VISIEKVRPLVVAITSSAMPTKLNVADILSERMLSQEDQATTSSSRSGSSRKILEASSVGAAKELVVGVHMSPGVMGGTLAGVFLLATLWISVSCFFTIESAPMMVNSPPGPSDGDPQFIGTPKEGTRFYPYMNQAVKEN